MREWARQHGIDGRSLHAWQMNISGRRATGTFAMTTPARLVEVVSIAPPPISTRRYVVRVGDMQIEIGDDFEADTLRQIVAILRAC